MSLLSRLFRSLGRKDDKSTVTQRPCSNCPSDCAIAGEACTVCEPYKRKLIDTLYYVDHLEEFLAKYEVADLAGEQVVNCPYCGARSSNPLGAKMSESTGFVSLKELEQNVWILLGVSLLILAGAILFAAKYRK